MITTGSFHVSSGEYTKMVFTRFFARYWTLYALLLAVFAALMNVNVNFIIVILALIFIVYPMTLSFVYFANWYGGGDAMVGFAKDNDCR